MSYSNRSSTEALCKTTIYILLFIVPLSFRCLEKAATIRTFLWHSVAYQLLILQDLTKALADLAAGLYNTSPSVPPLFPLLEAESRSSKQHVKIHNLMYLA